MPVALTTLSTLEKHLDRLGLEAGMHVVVHSRLITFGRIEGGAGAVFEVLRACVGKAGTLVFPTYTLNLDAADVYDPLTTPSHAMGVLSEYAWRRPGVRRTLCPMHGHAAIGARSDDVMASDYSKSWGSGSTFSVMYENRFHLLLLGCSFHEGATFVHHAEAVHGVPYREWLDLPRRVRRHDGTIDDIFCRYYGRKSKTEWTTDLQGIEDTFTRDDIGSRVQVEGRASYLVPLVDLQKCVFDMLDRDPYTLMRLQKDI